MIKVLSLSVYAIVAILFMTTGSIDAFEESIIASWLMEEGSGSVLKDSTGNHEDGEIFGEAVWVDGKFGKALRFDGTSTYVVVPASPDFVMLNSGDFSFAAWFKTDVSAADRGTWICVLQQGDLNGTGRTWLGIGPNTAATEQTYTYVGGGFTYGIPIEVGEWFHLAVVVEENGAADTIQVYSNGKPEAPSSKGMESCAGDYFIGVHKSLDPVNLWQGLIDEIIIMNKALSEAEVNDLMNAGLAAVESRGKLSTTWGSLKTN